MLTPAQATLRFLATRGSAILACLLMTMYLRFRIGPVGLFDFVAFAALMACWPRIEHAAHKYAMHDWKFLPFHLTHTRHHEELTPHSGLPDWWIVGLYYSIALVLFGFGRPYLTTIYVAVLTMLFSYEYVHYLCHCNYRPRTRWGRRVRKNHLKHHHFDDTRFMSMLFPSANP